MEAYTTGAPLLLFQPVGKKGPPFLFSPEGKRQRLLASGKLPKMAYFYHRERRNYW